MALGYSSGSNTYTAEEDLSAPVSGTPTVAAKSPVKQAVLKRLRCIDIVAFWEGSINAVALSTWFDISRKQATKDLATYREHNPGALEYHVSFKTFEVTPNFQPKFCEASEQDYIQHIQHCQSLDLKGQDVVYEAPGLDRMGLPTPRVPHTLFRFMLRAIRKSTTLRCLYLKDLPGLEYLDYVKLHFTPLKLVNSHLGWQLRVYDHDNDSFSMLRLNRIYDDPSDANKDLPVPEDEQWSKMVQLVAEPSTSLSSGEMSMVAADWGITNCKPLTVQVRECLVGSLMFYWRAIDPRLTFRVVNSDNSDWLDDSTSTIAPSPE